MEAITITPIDRTKASNIRKLHPEYQCYATSELMRLEIWDKTTAQGTFRKNAARKLSDITPEDTALVEVKLEDVAKPVYMKDQPGFITHWALRKSYKTTHHIRDISKIAE